MNLNPANVPQSVAYLIPVAAQWGFEDDADRYRALKRADQRQLQQLVHCMDQVDDTELEEWLAGHESSRNPPTREYIAITCLIITVSLARLRLNERT
jgi:hypothetical protein